MKPHLVWSNNIPVMVAHNRRTHKSLNDNWNPELNGKRVLLMEYIEDKDRWRVGVDNDNRDIVQVKVDNLRKIT